MKVQIINLKSKYLFERYINKYKFNKSGINFPSQAIEVRELSESEKTSIINLTNKHNIISFCQSDSILLLSHLKTLGSLFKDNYKNIFTIIENYTGDTNTYGIFNPDRASIMGILNVTPDSFSDGGKFNSLENAVKHAEEMIKHGADIIDIGGESTRPGAAAVSYKDELDRVIPVIKEIHNIYPYVKISIDTTKSKVAYEALKCGASIVNDINSFTTDKKVLDVVKEFDAAYILMHMQGTPQDMQKNPFYNDVTAEVYDYLSEKSEIAYKSGISKIVIDPGIGFGKRVEDNYELIDRLDEFKGIGFPILVGLSRKSFLGKTLNLEVTERDEATLAAETAAIKNGAKIIRTHNVKNAVIARDLLYYINNPEKI